MIISVGVGIAIFLYLLPACLTVKDEEPTALFERIQVEQHSLFQSTFKREKRSWQAVKRLQANEQLAGKLSQLLGVDRLKTRLILSRLRWSITIEEILLAKLIAGISLLLSLSYVAWRFGSGESIGIFQLIPALLALLAFLFPTMLLDWQDRQAKDEIREQVPVFFSIVQALIEAGMPVHIAVRTTAKRFDGRLGRELAWLEVEEKRYGNWRKALEEMAYRWDVDALISIAMEINEALKKGVSIAGMLAVQIEEQLKQQEDEASAHMNRLNVRLLPFVIVFMGAPLLFLVMGPAFLGIKENL